MRYSGKFHEVVFVACVDKNDPRTTQAEQFIKQNIANCIAEGKALQAQGRTPRNSDMTIWIPEDCESRGAEDRARRELNRLLR